MPPMSATTSQAWDDATSCHVEQPVSKSKPIQSSLPRNVRFAKNLDVKEVPHVRDMSEEEIHDTWYTPEDFEKIKKSMIVTIRLMMANKPVGHDQCSRGLEFRTPSGAKTRKKNKLDALTAVWNEQVSQWNDNTADEFAISFVYQQQSQKCREQARRFGLHDEKAAQQVDSLEDSVTSISLGSDTDEQLDMGLVNVVKISPAAA